MKRIALADCNNFYVSCERIFNPNLIGKPVVVLSSNDACIIARSNEAKALGIPMGVPLFEYERLLTRHKVYLFSANFGLYGDISSRVMQTITNLVPDIEIYSVDESFFHLPDFDSNIKANENFYSEYAKYIRKKVKQNVGIPISIGLGPSKILAKIANSIAKKRNDGVFDITDRADIDNILKEIKVEDVWGIGRRYAKKLNNYGIYNALQLKYSDDKWIKKNLTVCGLQIVLELRGISCMPLETNVEPKDSICVSRAFGRNVSSLAELKESVSTHITTAAEKLRKQGSLTSNISVFVCYAGYQDAHKLYKFSNTEVPISSDYTPYLINAAYNCLEKIYKPGLIYKKSGVILSAFVSNDNLQLSTFASLPTNFDKQNKIIKVVDKINNKLGSNKVFFASSGIEKKWKMKQLRKSPKYTTSWNELLTIKI